MKISMKALIAGVMIVPILVSGLAVLSPVSNHVSAVGPSADYVITGPDDAYCKDPIGLTVTQSAACNNKAGGVSCLFGKDAKGNDCVLTVIINFALYFIGAISVLMLIIGGVRYTLSGGNDKAVAAAKNTILYAVIGVVVALLAYAIVNFVLGTFTASA